jgi:hypothetical protein
MKNLFCASALLIIYLCLVNNEAWARPKSICEIDVRVNDLFAIITVDGKAIGIGHQVVPCKPQPQKVMIIAANKKPFMRTLPAISEFNPKDSYWNVRLLNTLSEPALTEAVRSSRGQADEILELLEPRLRQIEKSLQVREKPSPSAPVFAVSKFSRHPAMTTESKPGKLKGIFVQVRALPGVRKDRQVAVENLSHMSARLTGITLTMCPAYVPVTKREWTKILVGPMKDKNLAKSLAQKYGDGSFVIKNPPCPIRADDRFTM